MPEEECPCGIPNTGKQAHRATSDDIWSAWVLRGRGGGDPDYSKAISRRLHRIRDKVIDGARPPMGGTLLDIGCGDGLIGLGAIERLGESGSLIFSDVSQPLLDHVSREVESRGLPKRPRYLCCSAEALEGINDGEVDVVTMRAVLTYVQDKVAAAREIFRVLRPGGSVSIGEPVFRDQALQNCQLLRKLESQPDSEALVPIRLLARCRSLQFPATIEAIASSPLTSHTEWDLVNLFENAGFSGIHLEFHIDVVTAPPIAWNRFVEIAPHPLAPTLKEVMERAFSAAEASALQAYIQPMVEEGRWRERDLVAYLTATKPL